MDWPTAATIIASIFALVSGFVSIWTSVKVRVQGKAVSTHATRCNEDHQMLIARLERLEKQQDMLLGEIIEILKE